VIYLDRFNKSRSRDIHEIPKLPIDESLQIPNTFGPNMISFYFPKRFDEKFEEEIRHS
jgi:hypothetical protein